MPKLTFPDAAVKLVTFLFLFKILKGKDICPMVQTGSAWQLYIGMDVLNEGFERKSSFWIGIRKLSSPALEKVFTTLVEVQHTMSLH